MTVICGSGNNGGDGLVVTRLLREAGYQVTAILISSGKYSNECLEQLKKTSQVCIFGDSPVAGYKTIDKSGVITEISKAHVVVDALLGTGSTSAAREPIATLIELINSSKNKDASVVSVDLPSGSNADTGEIYDPVVKADHTLSLQFIKRGLLQYPAREVCGKLTALPIGIEPLDGCEFSLVTEESSPRLPKRRPDSHKGSYGHVVVIGGSPEMPGAAVLSASAALRSGAGLVTRAAGAGWPAILSPPEIMLTLLEEQGWKLSKRSADDLRALINEASVLVVGPGMGTLPSTVDFVRELITTVDRPIVLDADGLNCLSKLKDLRLNDRVIITPHPGEAATLLSVSTAEVQRDRFKTAKSLYERCGAHVVLKGAGTIVYGSGSGYVVSEGNPYMATAGSGDVLSGVLAGLIAQGMPVKDTSRAGALVHATAGDRAFKLRGGPITASDIFESLPAAIFEITEK